MLKSDKARKMPEWGEGGGPILDGRDDIGKEGCSWKNRNEELRSYLMKGTLLRDGVLDWSSFGLSNKLELGWLVSRHLNIDRAKCICSDSVETELECRPCFKDVELIKVEAEQEEMDPRLLETNKVLRKYRSGSAMLLRDLKDYLQDTLRMIPQTRIFSQLDDDKDEDEDYNETIQEEDEEQRRKEMKDGVLKPQMSNKNFLISPLDSQPMGWEQAEAIRDEIKILQGTELKLAQSKDWSATGKASRGKFLFWGMEVMAQDTLRMEENRTEEQRIQDKSE
ncbi:hypothetical protein PPACK8108_LOCUS23525 [Phakopsora pachyrhizi]|uniref:Uncharacterized protein n=1 Tax=Phakopsora pachyrhizi TaxID=170000 RepID=A0AAV0BQC7_PHAPC|nr:hypothetical protein PPACK8108_LOCUS23525 [Phakopsora pachyrhizi]